MKFIRECSIQMHICLCKIIFYQAEPNVVAAIMTKLSLKAGLKEWGEQAITTGRSDMKQLHLRKKFKPKHTREPSQVQR
jgi:hypothetical protein